MFKRFKHTQQHESCDCGVAAVSTILKSYHVCVSYGDIKEAVETDRTGTQLNLISEYFKSLGFTTCMIRTQISELTPRLTYPILIHVYLENAAEHYIVVHAMTRRNKFIISDPRDKSIRKVSKDTLEAIFSGNALFLISASDQSRIYHEQTTIYTFMRSLIRPNISAVILLIVSSIVMSILGLFSSTFPKLVMDSIIPYDLKNSLPVYGIIYIVCTIFQSILRAYRSMGMYYFMRRIEVPTILNFFEHLLKIPLQSIVQRQNGDLLTRFQDIISVINTLGTVTISVVVDVIIGTIALLLMTNTNPKLFGALVLIILINVLLIYFFKGPYQRINQQQVNAQGQVNSVMIESLQNIETIKSMKVDKYAINRFEKCYEKLTYLSYKEHAMGTLQQLFLGCINESSGIIFLMLGAFMIMDGSLKIGDLLVFQTLSQYFMGPIQNFIDLQMRWVEAKIAFERFDEIASLSEYAADYESHNMHMADAYIKIEEIGLKQKHKEVLKDLNLNVIKGSRVALVGLSGSGKSTFSKVLAGLVRPTTGTVSIANNSFGEVDDLETVKIGYMPQKPQLFQGTILENICCGRAVPVESIQYLIHQLGVKDIFDSMPQKLNTVLFENASNLSGGEQQIITLIRTLIHNHDIYILDEPTASLDSQHQKSVCEYLMQQNRERTMFIISHQILPIIHCDIVCFMENGTISGTGTHHQLLQIHQGYATLVENQKVDGL